MKIVMGVFFENLNFNFAIVINIIHFHKNLDDVR